MSYLILLKKGSNRQLATNFYEKEFYCKSLDAPAEHNIDSRLIDAAQLIRDFAWKLYKCKVKITSSYRTPLHTQALVLFNKNAVKNSPHLKFIAVDFKFISGDVKGANEWFSDQINTRAFLFTKLRQLGISGFGLYNGYFHIDTREKNNHPYFNSSDELGKLSVWDKKKKKAANRETVS